MNQNQIHVILLVEFRLITALSMDVPDQMGSVECIRYDNLLQTSIHPSIISFSASIFLHSGSGRMLESSPAFYDESQTISNNSVEPPPVHLRGVTGETTIPSHSPTADQ